MQFDLIVAGGGLHFYLPSFAGGGAERFFVRLANELSSQGENVHFIVNQATGPLGDLLSDNVTLHVLGVPKAMLAVPRLANYLRANRPEVLISALTRTNLTALLGARLSRTKTRVVVCERNQYSAFLRELAPIRRVLITRMVQRLYPTAHAVIGNTGDVTNDIARIARLDVEQTAIIHNPAPDKTEIEAARSLPIPHPWLEDSRPVAVAIGRLVPQKDYPTMLKAVAKSGPDLRLLVLGEGPEQSKLEALVAELGIDDRVDFLGYRMDRFSYLVRADLFLLSSRTEGFPNALIEAVSAGVAAISTDCAGGGAREILGREFPDRIVPVGDPDALAAVLRTTLDARNQATEQEERQRIVSIAGRYQISEIAHAFLERARA